MKTKYKYIEFIFSHEKPKTSIYVCVNIKSQACLGFVSWNCQWRQYCFYAELNTVFSSGCLDDISDFLKQINKNHKEGLDA